MFNPIRHAQQYLQRIENKRSVFNPDGKTLNLQELNRYVNGSQDHPGGVADGKYLWTSTSGRGQKSVSSSQGSKTQGLGIKGDRAETGQLLRATLLKDLEEGKYGPNLVPVAHAMINLTFAKDGALVDPTFRKWLKALATTQPVDRTDYMAEFNQGRDQILFVEVSDAEGAASGSVGSVNANDKLVRSEDIGTNDEQAYALDVPVLDAEDHPELHAAASDETLEQWVRDLDVSAIDAKHAKDIADMATDGIDVHKRDAQKRADRPVAQARTQRVPVPERDHRVVRMVHGQVVHVKK